MLLAQVGVMVANEERNRVILLEPVGPRHVLPPWRFTRAVNLAALRTLRQTSAESALV